jgi:hypothetical protein
MHRIIVSNYLRIPSPSGRGQGAALVPMESGEGVREKP